MITTLKHSVVGMARYHQIIHIIFLQGSIITHLRRRATSRMLLRKILNFLPLHWYFMNALLVINIVKFICIVGLCIMNLMGNRAMRVPIWLSLAATERALYAAYNFRDWSSYLIRKDFESNNVNWVEFKQMWINSLTVHEDNLYFVITYRDGNHKICGCPVNSSEGKNNKFSITEYCKEDESAYPKFPETKEKTYYPIISVAKYNNNLLFFASAIFINDVYYTLQKNREWEKWEINRTVSWCKLIEKVEYKEDGVSALTINSDTVYLATASYLYFLRLSDMPKKTFKGMKYYSPAIFSMTVWKNYLFVAVSDGTVRAWDTDELKKRLDRHITPPEKFILIRTKRSPDICFTKYIPDFLESTSISLEKSNIPPVAIASNNSHLFVGYINGIIDKIELRLLSSLSENNGEINGYHVIRVPHIASIPTHIPREIDYYFQISLLSEWLSRKKDEAFQHLLESDNQGISKWLCEDKEDDKNIKDLDDYMKIAENIQLCPLRWRLALDTPEMFLDPEFIKKIINEKFRPIMVVALNPGGHGGGYTPTIARLSTSISLNYAPFGASRFLREIFPPKTWSEIIWENLFKCRGDVELMNKRCLKRCRKILTAQLRFFKPRLILVLGRKPLNAILRDHGREHINLNKNIYVYWHGKDIYKNVIKKFEKCKYIKFLNSSKNNDILNLNSDYCIIFVRHYSHGISNKLKDALKKFICYLLCVINQ